VHEAGQRAGKGDRQQEDYSHSGKRHTRELQSDTPAGFLFRLFHSLKLQSDFQRLNALDRCAQKNVRRPDFGQKESRLFRGGC
jgi:hypothetical protein